MELEQALYRKQKLEKDIRDTVNNLVEGFIAEVGLYPSSIEIAVIDVTALGDAGQKTAIGSCEVVVNL